MPILDVAALATLTKKPNIDQVSLELLREFYATHLEPYAYIFELVDGRKIRLEFNKEHFCHLVGIQKMALTFAKKRERHKYFGAEGYKNIQGGTITLKSIRMQSKASITLIKDKLVFFYLLPSIVNSPNILLDYVSPPGGTKIECKLLAYNGSAEAFVHLGIDEDAVSGTYFSRTFFTERVTATNPGTKFITGQTPLKVVSTQIINKQAPPAPPPAVITLRGDTVGAVTTFVSVANQQS